MQAPYPWQQQAWQAMQQRIAAGRLPHAMLLHGPAGVGKLDFARLLSRALLCEATAAGLPCGNCRSCQLYAAGTHPDFQLIQPEEEGKEITIGQIRELLEWQALTAQYGRARVVVIEPAERMNLNAANALLKTLEEPGRDALLLLVSARPAALLPTIRSRCQQISLICAQNEAVQSWLAEQVGDVDQAALALAICNGAPLRALRLLQHEGMALRAQLFAELEAVWLHEADAVGVAARWMGTPLPETLGTLHSWLVDMARLKSSAAAVTLDNPDLRERLQALCERVDLRELIGRQGQLQEAMRLAQGHPNIQLLLEELLLGWSSGIIQPARRATSTR